MQPVVLIHAFDRPKRLLNLLRDLAREGAERVQVWDDATPDGLPAAEEFCAERGWERHRAESNHGKKRFWRWVSKVYQRQQDLPGDRWILLPDDVRLCEGFFARCEEYWAACPRGTVSLNLLRDESRLETACWTGVVPTRVNDKVEDVGYTDGLAVVNRRYFEALGWGVQPVPNNRWVRNPEFSSGVGDQVSKRLHAAGHKQMRVRQSLVQHVEGPSKMNPTVRLKDSMAAVEFVDGSVPSERLKVVDRITASMASMPSREADLPRVVASLRGQVDRLNVYLNGYDHVPECLKQPWITVARSQDHGDRGDAGKAFWTDKVEGYHLLCDDDLIYPPNYAQRIIQAIELRARRVVVGFHGRELKPTITTYYKSAKIVYHCLRKVQGAHPVHVAGTGALGYHTDTIKVVPEDFPLPNMADIWFSKVAQEQEVPLIVLPHGRDWLSLTRENQTDTIFRKHFRNDEPQTAVCKSLSWRLWPDPVSVPAAAPPREVAREVASAAENFWDLKARLRGPLADGHDAWGAAEAGAGRAALWKVIGQNWALRTGTVLDYGCGAGRFSEDVRKTAGGYLGVDISGEMLSIAKKKNKACSFQKCGIGSILSPDNAFKGVLICQVLEHISDALLPTTIRELRRVLAPRGRVMLLVNTHRVSGVKYDADRQLTYRTACDYALLLPGISARTTISIEGETHTLFAGTLTR